MTSQEHADKLDKVLARLTKEALTLHPKKFHIACEETKVLGFIIGNGQMQMDPKVMAGVKYLPQPATAKQLQKMLGLFNHYRRFIDKYAQNMAPLYKLLKKD